MNSGQQPARACRERISGDSAAGRAPLCLESGAGPPGRTALGSITRVRIAWALVSFGCMGPFFYPVTNEVYATELARDWNTKYEASGWTGYVLT